MVGAKSMGCSTCKRRKVKCDERTPICTNCERGGRNCAGPKSRFIRYLAPGVEEDLLQRDEIAIIKLCATPSSSSSDLLASDLVCRLNGIKEIGFQLQLLGNFFPYLPSRVGNNPALEASLRCLLSTHQSVLYQNGKIEEDLPTYNRALSLIRKDLSLSQSKASSETVCAAKMLLLCETYKTETGTQRSAWMIHAGGVSALIKAWGPDRIVSEFDLAIFASHYGSNVSECIFTGKDDCFLASPEWESVRDKCLSFNVAVRLDKYILDSLTALAWLPDLLADIRHCSGRHSTLQKAKHFKAHVFKHAAILGNDLKNPLIVRESSASQSVLVPTKYEFCQEKVAFRYCLFWATIIIANSILGQFEDGDSSLEQEIQSAAECICMSLEYLRRLKPVGVPSLTFIVSMVFGVSSKTRRAQLVKEMNGLFESLPVEIGPSKMDYIFNYITGRPVS